MKVTKHAYELVKVAEGSNVYGYTVPLARVGESYILAVKGAKAVYEVNADVRIAPVSTTAHQSIIYNGKELDGDYETYAQRTTAANTTEDVKTYDFGAIKLLYVCVTYTVGTNMYFEVHASEDGTTWTPVYSDKPTIKATACFFTRARYLKWVNRNISSGDKSTNLFELEAYDCRRTTIVSYPDEFGCIIHEARRKIAADGSNWYIFVVEPDGGLAYDYWLYKLKPTRAYYKVTLE